jgi:hypothetical protein
MSAHERPTSPAAKHRDARRLRDIAFAVIAILAMLAVLAAAMIVPFARAARLPGARARTSPTVGRFRSCLPEASACTRHERPRFLPARTARGREAT